MAAQQPARAKRGYALPAVLTIVTILTLIYMVCILALENLRSETVAAVDTAELERVAVTAEARFAFLASTEPMGQNALQIGGVRVQTADLLTGTVTKGPETRVVTPLKLDNQPYLWREAEGGVGDAYLASVQDTAGLVNLDHIDQAGMGRLLRILGVSDDSADQVAAKFDAYHSPTILSSEERAQGPIRPLSPIGLMRRYAEVFGVPELQTQLSAEQKRRFTALTTVQPDSSTLNINTAPAEALQAWYGISADDAVQIVRRRATEVFASPLQIGVNSSADFGAYTFPNGRFRFSLSSRKGRGAYTSTIVLTPGSFERPFWVQDAQVQNLPHVIIQRTDEIQPFPSIPNIDPSSGRQS